MRCELHGNRAKLPARLGIERERVGPGLNVQPLAGAARLGSPGLTRVPRKRPREPSRPQAQDEERQRPETGEQADRARERSCIAPPPRSRCARRYSLPCLVRSRPTGSALASNATSARRVVAPGATAPPSPPAPARHGRWGSPRYRELVNPGGPHPHDTLVEVRCALSFPTGIVGRT